jgi:hypothetical protein
MSVLSRSNETGAAGRDRVAEAVSVELTEDIIVARITGEVTEERLRERHALILARHRESGCSSLLLDDLGFESPSYREIELQRAMNTELNSRGFRIAIVVPDSRTAYFARLQFGDGKYKIFYNGMADAIAWLSR